MKKLILSFAGFAVLLLSACSGEKDGLNSEKAFRELELLEGAWKMSLDSSSVEEVWRKENDTLYKGYTYEVDGADTVITELIELYLSNNQVYYVPTTYGQNDGNPVPFKLTSLEGGAFNFTNHDHDFPNLISYLFITKDHVVATVSGDMEGTTRSLDFDYYRQ